MAYLALANGGLVQVDEEDREWLERLGPWRRSREGYVYRGSRETGDIQKMHLTIADRYGWDRRGKYIDHKYQNKDDMRKSYLAPVTPKQSNINRRAR